MLEHRATHTRRRRRSARSAFRHILCAVDGIDAAIEQAIAISGGDARIAFAASWYGTASLERAAASEKEARRAVNAAVSRARQAGVEAESRLFHAPRLSDALLRAAPMHDLVVVGAHSHARATGIVLGETSTLLVHRSSTPVLIAREMALGAGVVAGTRAVRADRRPLTAAARVAARLEANLTVVHVPGRDDERRRTELRAELANTRALLGRRLDYVKEYGSAARALVRVAEGDGAGLIVVGSTGRLGVPALASVSERVAHLAPCSVLVMRGG